MANNFQIVEKVSWKEMDGIIIAVNTESGAYYALNKTASQIWKMIAAGKDRHDVQTQMEDQYAAAPATILADLESSLAEWLKEGLIVETQD